MTFRALVIDKAADGAISQSVRELADDLLPEGDVTVRIDYSTLNYKDGLCMYGQGGAGAHLSACSRRRFLRGGRDVGRCSLRTPVIASY